MKKIHKKLFIFILSVVILSTAGFALALEGSYPTVLGEALKADPTLPDLIKYIVNIAIKFSAMLTGLTIVIGGIMYIVSGVAGQYRETGKDWIKSGLLGGFLLVCAYIILATVNPALVGLQAGQLLSIIPYVGTSFSQLSGPTQVYYKEIPMGTLTEITMSKTISCYDYDDLGDPILNKVTIDNGSTVDGPTYLDHDRVDCLIKLNLAIEKKAKIIKNLSQKISNIMSFCNCSSGGGGGAKTCKEENGEKCPDPIQIGKNDCDAQNQYCGKGLKCACDGGNPNACEPDQAEFNLCPAGTKEQIQNGPITVDNYDWKDFSSGFVGKGVGSDAVKMYVCMQEKTSDKKQYQGLKEFNTSLNVQAIINLVESNAQVDKKDITLINKQNWDNLKLIEQLMYLREKLSQMATTLNQDNNNLTKAREELSACYLSKSYVDYLKTVEQADKNNQIIMVQKNFNSYENKFTDISKYCNGFGYANTNCYYNCENMCPSSSDGALSLFQTCQAQDCNSLCTTNDPGCIAQKNNCLQQQKICLDEKFGDKPCPNSASGKFQNFNGCISSCQDECKNTCEAEYKSCKTASDACNSCTSQTNSADPICTKVQTACNKYDDCLRVGNGVRYCASLPDGILCNNQRSILTEPRCQGYKLGDQLGVNCDKLDCMSELKKCTDTCGNNSQCVLNNKEACLYNPTAFIQCSNLNSDSANIQNCFNNAAYTCKYGSYQQAGYPDCLVKPYSLGNKYSSSDIYKNQGQQKCQNPFIPSSSGQCSSASSPKTDCIDVCPESSKCPSASACPQCPCDTLGKTGDSSKFDPSGKTFASVYGHMKNITVSVGQIINQGDVIGQLSNVDTNEGSHLHFAVGFEITPTYNPDPNLGNFNPGLNTDISFDISSKISVPGTSGLPGSTGLPTPKYVNQNYKNFVLDSLNPPVDLNKCSWDQIPGSYLHNNYAAYAQDWGCKDGSQEGVDVYAMAGGENISSKVIQVDPTSGFVVIQHTVNKDTLNSLLNITATDYRVVGGECQETKYNDDPLTFYCPQNWWNSQELKKPQPLANNYVCPKQNEIPIGQTVDDTQAWAKKLLEYNSEYIQKTDEIIKILKEIDSLNQSGDYCKCGSTCGNGEVACNAPCAPNLVDDGNGGQKCACTTQECQGNPCQRMINLLLGKVAGAKCPEGVKIDGPVQLYSQIKTKLDTMAEFYVKGRSEITKELSYSRKKINSCSSEGKANTIAQQTTLISCERVEANFISPIDKEKTILNNKEINFPCYGKTLGDIYGSTFNYGSSASTSTSTSTSPTTTPAIKMPATDNWFCCQPIK